MAKGKSFEIFIENLERLLNKDNSTTIEKNVYLTSSKGIRRQIDVLLTHKIDRHIFRTIIECKDWKRKPDIKVIDEFSSKLKSVGVEKGIIVSRSGFTSGLLKEAKAYSFISLYTIDEVEDIASEIIDFNRVGFFKITYNSNDWTVRFAENQEINDSMRLYTKLKFGEGLKEFDVTEITQDYLTKNKDFIINKIFSNNQIYNNTIEAQLTLDINLPQKAFYETESIKTFITGFKSVIQTTVKVNIIEIESVSKYQNLSENKTVAVLINLKLDEETKKLILDDTFQ
jgi:hypothetical protein